MTDSNSKTTSSPELESTSSDSTTEFERQAEQPSPGVIAEFVDFLKTNKKWWLTPIIIAIVLLTLFGILGQSVIAPFIYPLF